MDMIGLALKGMGIDPAAVMKQAMEIGTAFEKLREELAIIRANQEIIMAHFGLYVPPPPTGEIMALIEHESAKFLQPAELERA